MEDTITITLSRKDAELIRTPLCAAVVGINSSIDEMCAMGHGRSNTLLGISEVLGRIYDSIEEALKEEST